MRKFDIDSVSYEIKAVRKILIIFYTSHNFKIIIY